VDQKFHGRMLMAEANQWPEDAAAYFGERGPVPYRMPLSADAAAVHGRADGGPRPDHRYRSTRRLPVAPGSQWILFLRNQDELTLEMVTEEERTAMYRYFARNPQARVHSGIRRRLAPLMENDRAQDRAAQRPAADLPGTPVDLLRRRDRHGRQYLPGRPGRGAHAHAVVGPDRNAGFSEAETQQLFLPVISDPRYHYETSTCGTNRTTVLRCCRG
jgi:maltose alpha-D-glucosyltransferase / alpha-amylase